ncbi:MAG: HIT family protein [Bauldia sp.]
MRSSIPRFSLDPGLAASTQEMARLGLSDLRLMDDARFPWVLLIPRKADATEIVDLGTIDQSRLIAEISMVSKAMKAATNCDKLNVAAIGNMVAQLHIHVVARFKGDAAWPKPVWGFGAPVAYPAPERDKLVARLLAALPS